jgi:hypothetical protein
MMTPGNSEDLWIGVSYLQLQALLQLRGLLPHDYKKVWVVFQSGISSR